VPNGEAPGRTVARCVLGLALFVAGVGHLTAQRVEFQAQVPPWFPVDADLVVVVSGVVEILLGVALVVAGSRAAPVGVATAVFFVVIFPGNVAQFVEQRDAFGLDSDTERFVRLWFQPLLVVWALWSTGGWRWLRSRARSRS
jgi:uncharacterized membrane protein